MKIYRFNYEQNSVDCSKNEGYIKYMTLEHLNFNA